MPGLKSLDTAFAIHGIPLNAPAASVAWLRRTSSGVGKRWRLTKRYGAPRPGNVAGQWYWLGRRTYILYEEGMPKTTVHIAGLDMLNEQLIETSVRQEARTALGWQPDSLGLARQFALPNGQKEK